MNDIAPFGSEGYLDRVGKGVDTFQDGVSAVLIEFDDLFQTFLYILLIYFLVLFRD